MSQKKGPRVDITGRRFDKLIVIGVYDSVPYKGVRWLCLCDCGNHAIKFAYSLAEAKHTGCRECQSQSRSASRIRHGARQRIRKHEHARLYSCWKGMHDRCTIASHPGFKYWGGKGVTVCGEWATFEPFRDWALTHGYTDEMTMERQNPDGNYEPANCEWITKGENTLRAIACKRTKTAAAKAAQVH